MKKDTLLILGRNKSGLVSLSDFSWDCGLYWSGGFLDTQNTHYHFKSYYNTEVMTIDAVKADFGDNLTLTDEQLWRFVELFNQFYKLTEAADILGRHNYSEDQANPKELNKELAKNINEQIENVVIPEVRSLCEEIRQSDTYKDVINFKSKTVV